MMQDRARDRFQRERLGTAFPKLFWQWEQRSSPLVISYTFVNKPRLRNSLCSW